jgi:flavin-dependent dehydrogenase
MSASSEPAHVADVAIVGLGPVGATLALLLDRAGLSVVALEREAEPYARLSDDRHRR